MYLPLALAAGTLMKYYLNCFWGVIIIMQHMLITSRGNWGYVFAKDLIFVPLGGSAAATRDETYKNLFLLTVIQTSPSDAEKRQNFTNEKLYLRIPTSVDAIIFTMQNGKYNAVLLSKIVLIDLTIYVLPL